MFRRLRSDYFGRAWIIREVVMAKRYWVMLFRNLMEWDWLVAIGAMFQSKFERHYPALRRRTISRK
jgi:hypothetical protein